MKVHGKVIQLRSLVLNKDIYKRQPEKFASKRTKQKRRKEKERKQEKSKKKKIKKKDKGEKKTINNIQKMQNHFYGKFIHSHKGNISQVL